MALWTCRRLVVVPVGGVVAAGEPIGKNLVVTKNVKGGSFGEQ